MKTVNHEYYVSPEIAKLLKKAGFDWRVRYMYRNNNPTLCICTERSYRNTPKLNKCPMYWQYAAPTLEVAQRWLREVKNEIVLVDATGPKFYSVSILGRNSTNKNFDTYEKALEAGIKKALKIILEGGE